MNKKQEVEILQLPVFYCQSSEPQRWYCSAEIIANTALKSINLYIENHTAIITIAL